MHAQMVPYWRGKTGVVQDEAFVTAKRSSQRATCRTSRRDQPEALAGVHAAHVLLLIDEASGVPESVFETGRGSLTSPGARVFMASNPTRVGGFFHASHHKNRSQYTVHHLSCYKSRHVRQKWIDEMRNDYGEDSVVFCVRVKGEFPPAGSDILIPLDLVTSAQLRDTPLDPTAKKRGGLDVAWYGDDFSALVTRQGSVVLPNVDRWHGYDAVESAGRAQFAYNEGRVDTVAVDTIGFGGGAYSILDHAGVPVLDVNVARRPSVSKFALLQDELWWRVREFLMTDDASLPTDEECTLMPKLTEELTSVTYKMVGGKIKVADKLAMKEIILRSPDIADAFCLTFADGRGREETRRRRRELDGPGGRGIRKGEESSMKTKPMLQAYPKRDTVRVTWEDGQRQEFYIRGAVAWPRTIQIAGVMKPEGAAIVGGVDVKTQRIHVLAHRVFSSVRSVLDENGFLEDAGGGRFMSSSFFEFGCSRWFSSCPEETLYVCRKLIRQDPAIDPKPRYVPIPSPGTQEQLDMHLIEAGGTGRLILENGCAPVQRAMEQHSADAGSGPQYALYEALALLVYGFGYIPWKEPRLVEPEYMFG